MGQCQYLGPEYDPRKHRGETPYCGQTTIAGKQYCHEHYYVVYKKGTAIAGRRKEKAIEQEINELKRLQEIEDLENAE
jgi:hypothetical protein